jgi:septum formation protein
VPCGLCYAGPVEQGYREEPRLRVRLSLAMPLILGSGSPRRRDILAGMGVPISVLPADADERVVPGELPEVYIERIVALKLEAVKQRLTEQSLELQSEQAVNLQPEPAWKSQSILVADTLVTVDGAILGKPVDRDDSLRLLSLLNARSHAVLTRYCIETPHGTVARTVQSEVEFRKMTAAELARYADSGEGRDKAGSYALQGKGAALVRAVRGSVTGVIGLPAAEVCEDLAELGLWEAFL